MGRNNKRKGNNWKEKREQAKTKKQNPTPVEQYTSIPFKLENKAFETYYRVT